LNKSSIEKACPYITLKNLKMNYKLLKPLLIFFFFAVSSAMYAQKEITIQKDSKNFSEQFDNASVGLIKSRIPFGALYDRVYQWSNLENWHNADTTSLKRLYQTWYDAEQSIVEASSRPQNYLAMRKAVQQKIFEVKLPVIAIQFHYGLIVEEAKQDGRLSIKDDQMIDNNKESPYATNHIYMTGIGIEEAVVNKSYALQFDQSISYNNTGEPIEQIEVTNTTTGETYPVLKDQASVLIEFKKQGKNVLRFTTILANKNTVFNYQVINVLEEPKVNTQIGNRPIGPNCYPSNELLQSNIPFQGYEESFATNSFADYHIYYHTQSPTATDCERVLRKPIIILDGFDPQDANSSTNIYDSYLAYNNANYVNTKLGDDLRDKGYDVIILNFPKLGSTVGSMSTGTLTIPSSVQINGTSQTINLPNRDGGTDYMERNAFLLVKLIQEVNAALPAGSTEKLVIVGPSMGGQISRYALAYMEKQQSLGVPNMNHNTRLFLSFDSPNDGANIPLALGYDLNFFGNFAGNQDAQDSYNQKLHSVAARQLLIEQMDGLNSAASFHQTFFNNIRNGGLPGSGGYPVNLRKVALLNGSGSSIKTYSDGIEVLNLHGTKRLIFNTSILVFIAENNFMPSPGQNIRIAKTRITTTGPLTFYNGTFNVTNNNSRGSMDAVQGSTFTATQAVYEGFSAGLAGQGINQNLTTLRPLHCFIPSVSALAFRNPNFDWNSNIANRNLLCNNEIYFDGYFMPKTNESHISLTTENVDWLTQEIDKGQPNCLPICSSSILGISNVCLNSDQTYTFDASVPAGCTVTWEPSTRYQIISSTNNSIIVRGTMTGIAFIKAHIQNPCGADVNLTKEIFVGGAGFGAYYKNGVSTLPVKIYDPFDPINSVNDVCIGYGFPNTYIDAQPYGGGNVYWSIASGYPSSSGFSLLQQSNNRAYFSFNYQGATTGYLEASISNACGAMNQVFAFKQINCNTTGGDPCEIVRTTKYFTVSPNPSTIGVIKIGIANKPIPIECVRLANSFKLNNGIIISSVNVYNNLGTLLKTLKNVDKKEITINTSGFIPGSYLVEITSGKYVEKQVLIVQQ
jgi:hypothetical protein